MSKKKGRTELCGAAASVSSTDSLTKPRNTESWTLP